MEYAAMKPAELMKQKKAMKLMHKVIEQMYFDANQDPGSIPAGGFAGTSAAAAATAAALNPQHQQVYEQQAAAVARK